jgi:hypothetical protein
LLSGVLWDVYLTSFKTLESTSFSFCLPRKGYNPKWFKNSNRSIYPKLYIVVKNEENVWLKIRYGVILFSHFILMFISILCFFMVDYLF